MEHHLVLFATPIVIHCFSGSEVGFRCDVINNATVSNLLTPIHQGRVVKVCVTPDAEATVNGIHQDVFHRYAPSPDGASFALPAWGGWKLMRHNIFVQTVELVVPPVCILLLCYFKVYSTHEMIVVSPAYHWIQSEVGDSCMLALSVE
jgi:hypothetical protein